MVAPKKIAVEKPMSKVEAKKRLVELTDSNKVMNSKTFTKASELLKISNAAEEYPYSKKMNTKDYEREKRLLQIELLKVQKWLKDEKKKIVTIFEGVTRQVKEVLSNALPST